MSHAVNVARIKTVYDALEEIAREVVFVCGATVSLYASPASFKCCFIALYLYIPSLRMTVLEKNNQAIQQLCKQHKVRRLYAFGSVLTEHFSKESDIDLMVTFHAMDVAQYADNYFTFKFSLQDVLHHPIDLLEEKAIKNPYFLQSVSQKRQLVYGH